jgi:osmotically-inducible protein OsmY
VPVAPSTVAIPRMSAFPSLSKGTGSGEIQIRIDHALKQSPHDLGRDVTGTHADGIVVLQGRVDTFFHKQVAQELLRKLDGVQRVVNLLEVHWGETHRKKNSLD